MTEPLRSKPQRHILAALYPVFRPYRRALSLGIGASVVSAALDMVRPLLLARLIGVTTPSVLVQTGAAFAVLTIAAQTARASAEYSFQAVGVDVAAALRMRIFELLHRLKLRALDRTPMGTLVSRATADVDQVVEPFTNGVFGAAGDLLAVVGTVAVMTCVDARLAAATAIVFVAVGITLAIMRRLARRMHETVRSRLTAMSAFVSEHCAGIHVVQAYQNEDRILGEFANVDKSYRIAHRRANIAESFVDGTMELLTSLCIASLLWWAAASQVRGHGVPFATIVMFTQYVRQLFAPLSVLGQKYATWQRAMVGAELVVQLLHESDLEEEGGSALAGDPAHLSADVVEFDNVTFAYVPGHPVLHAVSLRVRRGEKVALVGATGSGKSTVTNLVLRLYEADSGEVRVFGRDVREYRCIDLRAAFSVVPQQVYLFAGTIASNVAMSEAPDMGRVKDALASIGALQRFQDRDDGLAAVVEEGGVNLSGGERQLIALARAVYRPAAVLILDEATASLDAATESTLEAAIASALAGRTALVIAHRLATVRHVDRILVFDRGTVVESGSHRELLARGDVYARLCSERRSSRPPEPAQVVL